MGDWPDMAAQLDNVHPLFSAIVPSFSTSSCPQLKD